MAAAPAAPAVTPEMRASAEKLYRDLYGSEHDAAAAAKDPAEKLAFAKKLVEAAKVAGDSPAVEQLLRENAAEFAAADPAGFTLALEMIKALPAGKARNAALHKLAAQTDKILAKEKPAGKPAVAAELVWVLRESARGQAADGQFPAATASLDKAKSLVRTYVKPSAEQLKEIDEQAAGIVRAGKEASAVRTAEQTLKAVPNDPAANAVVGLYGFLHDTDPGCKCEACRAKFAVEAPYLSKAAEPAYQKLGEALAAKEPTDLALADACRNAARATTDKSNKEALLERAVKHYRAALEAEPSGPEALRIKLLLEQLAPETTASAPAADPAHPAEPKAKPAATTKPAPAKPAPNSPYPAKRDGESQTDYAKRCAALAMTGLPANETQFIRITVEDEGKTVKMTGATINMNTARTIEARAKVIPGVETVDNEVNSGLGKGNPFRRKKF